MTYYEKLHVYCDENMIKINSVAKAIGISKVELSNVFKGHQATVKGFTQTDIINKINDYLGTDIALV